MQTEDRGETPERGPLDVDRQIEFSVLEFLLGEHPAQVTEAEIVCYRAGLRAKDAAPFGESDEVERAVDQLAGAGLLRCQGCCVVLTRAARYFDWLAEER